MCEGTRAAEGKAYSRNTEKCGTSGRENLGKGWRNEAAKLIRVQILQGLEIPARGLGFYLKVLSGGQIGIFVR